MKKVVFGAIMLAINMIGYSRGDRHLGINKHNPGTCPHDYMTINVFLSRAAMPPVV